MRGVRLWRTDRSYCTLIVVTLGLGIGATAVAFSVLAGTILQKLPFTDADRLVSPRVTELGTGDSRGPTLGLFLRWQKTSASLESLAAYSEYRAFVTGADGRTAVYPAALVTRDFLKVLRIQPVLGAGIGASDQETLQVALLSHRAWVRDFDSAPSVIGQLLTVNGQSATVAGVLPEGFDFPSGQDIWLEMGLDEAPSKETLGLSVSVVCRLAHGASAVSAQSELTTITSNYEAQGSSTGHGSAVVVEPFVRAHTDPRLRAMLLPMVLAIGAVLALASGNAAHLIFTKGLTERRILAIKLALGASRMTLFLTRIFETLTLALFGAFLSLPLTYLGVTAFNHFMAPGEVLRAPLIDVRLDARVAVFVVLAAAGTTLLASAFSTSYHGSAGPGDALRSGALELGSNAPAHGSRLLLTLELALATGVLFATGLLLHSVAHLREIDVGVEGGGVLGAKVSTVQAPHLETQAASRHYFTNLSRKLESLPGVKSAAYVSSLPTEGSFWRDVMVADQAQPVHVRWLVISPGLFETLGVKVLQGRDFRPAERASGAPEVVVSRQFARRYLGPEALGTRLRFSDSAPSARARTVVGVVSDYLMTQPGEEQSAPAIFTPLRQDPRKSMEIVVRTRPNFSLPASTMCSEATRLNPGVACFDTRRLEAILGRRTWLQDALATLFSGLSLLAVVLGTTGTFGIVSLLAARRRRELGVRIALGATRQGIEGLVLAEVAKPVLLGLLLGFAGGLTCARLLSGFLYGVKTWDPLVVVTTAAVLVASAALAAYWPARTAAKLDPANSLRVE